MTHASSDDLAPASPGSAEERVLVLARVKRDAELTERVLREAGILVHTCRSIGELCGGIEGGAAAAILASETLCPNVLECLTHTLASQPRWSDLPLILLTPSEIEQDVILEKIGARLDFTVVERPVRVSTLVSVVRSALRARRRQYEVRGLLASMEEMDRRKDRFLAVLGHELRNPLSAARVALGLIEETREAAGPAPAIGHACGVLDRQLRALERIVEDVLDSSRIAQGKLALQLASVDLGTLAQGTVDGLRHHAERKRQTLAFEAGAAPVLVRADDVRIGQVISNLVTNAVRYTPDGGRVAVRVRRENGHAVLRVTDTGVGIPPEMQARIFEPFAQAHGSGLHGGLGLGLSVVKALVELHEGEIHLRSEGAGKGTEVIVRLPLEAHPQAAVTASVADDGARGLDVLVVEDDREMSDLIRRQLERWGHRARVVDGGAAAWDELELVRPDVLLADVGLPGSDGYLLASRVKAAHGARPALVAMSGYGEPQDVERATRAGFDHQLVKPIDMRALRALLERVARERRHPASSGRAETALS